MPVVILSIIVPFGKLIPDCKTVVSGKLVLDLISHPNSNTVPFSKTVVLFKIEPF